MGMFDRMRRKPALRPDSIPNPGEDVSEAKTLTLSDELQRLHRDSPDTDTDTELKPDSDIAPEQPSTEYLGMVELAEPAGHTDMFMEVLNGSYSVAGRRERNEDFCLADQTRNLWVVSDGIGGAPFGDVMSRICCNATPSAWDALGEVTDIPERMRSTITNIDKTASAISVLLGDEGSGATYLLAHFDGSILWTAAVGDTRVYLLRDGRISRIGGTGRPSRHSNFLDSAMGYQLDLTPDINATEVRDNDVILLATDGVWSTQTRHQMASALIADQDPRCLSRNANPQQMARMVVDGSDMSDNATAIVLLFEESQMPTEDPSQTAPDTAIDPGSTAAFPLLDFENDMRSR